MARTRKNLENEAASKEWQEATLIETFNLNRITEYQTPLMQEWLKVNVPIFDAFEQTLFDKIYKKGVKKIAGWSEEDLKMKFISHILKLGRLVNDKNFVSFFETLPDALLWVEEQID